MSKYLPQNRITEFEAEVKHEYQSDGGSLRNSVSLRTNVTGDSKRFNRMGRGMAQQKASQADVNPMDISHANQTAYLANWYASEYTDIFDQKEVPYEEQQELAKSVKNAIRRRESQIVIGAVYTGGLNGFSESSTDPDYGRKIDMTTKNFGIEALHNIVAYYQDIEVWGNDEIHVLMDPYAQQFLLQSTKVTSDDFNIAKPLTSGNINPGYLGLYYHVIGRRREEGGLPNGGAGNYWAFAYAKSAIGLAIGIDLSVEINYVPVKTSWLVTGKYKAGAVVREGQGVVQIEYTETSTTGN